MSKRERILSLLAGEPEPGYTPAAFFLHFDPQYHRGRAAVERHLEFFRHTGMDFVKIQYEHRGGDWPAIERPDDWDDLPLYDEAFFAEPLAVVEGLVRAASAEALVVVTLYSPFMWASQLAGDERLLAHIAADPNPVRRGLETITDTIRAFVRGCFDRGVDGFYTSTQGGERHRLADPALFDDLVRPFDLSLMQEIDQRGRFNILHICDYAGSYDDLSRFADYPGHVVNPPLHVAGRRLPLAEAAALFGRPVMGGLDRLGVLATGPAEAIVAAAEAALAEAPPAFILAADCTVPADTPWDNLRLAVATAHGQGSRL
jgi:uroporphyrinogen decarboxylase